MKHFLNLCQEPFELIKAKNKVVEMRLFDEKRKIISVGDTIEFTNQVTFEKIEAKVINLKKFPDFESLYAFYDKSKLGYLPNEQAKASDMNKYYSNEKIKKYGTLAIEIELLHL